MISVKVDNTLTILSATLAIFSVIFIELIEPLIHHLCQLISLLGYRDCKIHSVLIAAEIFSHNDKTE